MQDLVYAGRFAELELHKSVFGPGMAVFFPSFSLLGAQVCSHCLTGLTISRNDSVLLSLTFTLEYWLDLILFHNLLVAVEQFCICILSTILYFDNTVV